MHYYKWNNLITTYLDPLQCLKVKSIFYERFLIVHQILEMVQKHGVHFYNGGSVHYM